MVKLTEQISIGKAPITRILKSMSFALSSQHVGSASDLGRVLEGFLGSFLVFANLYITSGKIQDGR